MYLFNLNATTTFFADFVVSTLLYCYIKIVEFRRPKCPYFGDKRCNTMCQFSASGGTPSGVPLQAEGERGGGGGGRLAHGLRRASPIADIKYPQLYRIVCPIHSYKNCLTEWHQATHPVVEPLVCAAWCVYSWRNSQKHIFKNSPWMGARVVLACCQVVYFVWDSGSVLARAGSQTAGKFGQTNVKKCILEYN